METSAGMRGGHLGRSRLGSIGLFGVFLGLVGALLDFYSGYQILTQSAMIPGGMGILENGYNLAWGAGISALGAVLLVTTTAGATSVGMHRMKTFGAIMALYGIVMLFIGLSMYSGVTPMMAGNALSGLGMLAVGALMIVNGGVMYRPRTVMASVPRTGHSARNAYLAIAGIVIVAAGVVIAVSIGHGPAYGGMQSTSKTTSNMVSTTVSAQVLASSASCSGSGTTEQCRMTLTNSGNVGTAITGAGTLSYGGAGAMGMNNVSTSTGCTVLTGSLDPGLLEQVSCTFTVSGPASSGTQFSGTVALRDGTSVPFSGTV